MLYSHNQENEKLKLFTLFLNRALQGEGAYASIVNEVILETHQYTVGHKNLYEINRDSFNLILMLAELEATFFRGLSDDPSEYNAGIYTKVLQILDEKQPAIVY